MMYLLLIVFGSQIVQKTQGFDPHFMKKHHHLKGPPFLHGPPMHPGFPGKFGPKLPPPPHFFHNKFPVGPAVAPKFVPHPKKIMAHENFKRPLHQAPSHQLQKAFVEAASHNFVKSQRGSPSYPQPTPKQEVHKKRIVVIRPRIVEVPKQPVSREHSKPRLVPFDGSYRRRQIFRETNVNINNENNFDRRPHSKPLPQDVPKFNENSWNHIKDNSGGDFRGDFRGSISGGIMVPRNGEYNELDKITKYMNKNWNPNNNQVLKNNDLEINTKIMTSNNWKANNQMMNKNNLDMNVQVMNNNNLDMNNQIFNNNNVDINNQVMNKNNWKTNNQILNNNNLDINSQVINNNNWKTNNQLLNNNNWEINNQIMNNNNWKTNNQQMYNKNWDINNQVMNQNNLEINNQVMNNNNWKTNNQLLNNNNWEINNQIMNNNNWKANNQQINNNNRDINNQVMNNNNWKINNQIGWKRPHLREVIDTDISVEINKNSIESAKSQNVVSSQSQFSKVSNNNIHGGLAGQTLDFTGSTVLGSKKEIVGEQSLNSLNDATININIDKATNLGLNNNFGSEQSINNLLNAANLVGQSISDATINVNVNPNNNNIHDQHFINNNNNNNNNNNIGSTGHIDLTSVKSSIATPQPFNAGSGLGGSFIDLTGIGNNQAMNTPVQAQAAATIPFGLDSATANAGNSAASAIADLNGNVLGSATDLIGTGDVVIIDNIGQTVPLPTDLGMSAPASALTNVVDLTGTAGSLNGQNIADFGAVDVLTLDNAAFAQLEQALQSGQAVSAQLLDSIIGGGGSVAGMGGFPTSQGSGMADVGVVDVGSPQIYLLDGAQAHQIAGAADFAGAAGPPHTIIDAHVDLASSSLASSQKTSQSSQKTSSTSTSHTIADIPHAGAVAPGQHGPSLPGGHGNHDIVGVVGEPVGSITVGANTDIVGLFSVPNAHHFPDIPASVASIPKSIGHRMTSAGHGGKGQGQTKQSSGHTMHSMHV